MNFDLLMKCCIDEINKKNIFKHPKYKSKVKYSNEYYLTMIFYMLNDVNNWSFLSKIQDSKLKCRYHYKTIYNKFRLWSSLYIFKDAFDNYKTLLKSNLLLIDSTSINNKYGSENVVMNPEYRKKRVTKLSIITNKKGFIHSVVPFDIKNKNKDYSTAVHDVKMIKNNINDIKNINNGTKYYHLLADKGYKTKVNYKLNNKKIIIITPNKKNSVTKNKKFKNKKLKLRIKIENVNCFIKKYSRISERKDR